MSGLLGLIDSRERMALWFSESLAAGDAILGLVTMLALCVGWWLRVLGNGLCHRFGFRVL